MLSKCEVSQEESTRAFPNLSCYAVNAKKIGNMRPGDLVHALESANLGGDTQGKLLVRQPKARWYTFLI